jgi:IS30 family transposase
MEKIKSKNAKKRRSRRRPFEQLNQEKRDRMEILLKRGELQKDIAFVLKVDPSTISREKNKRKRKNGCYDADTAQRKARVKRANASYKGKKVEQNKDAKKHIITELKAGRSPDEISGRMKEEKKPFYVGKDAIYAWLRSPYGQKYCKYLCTKRYRKKTQKRTAKRQMIPNRTPLSARPEEGIHTEGDLFVSPMRLHTTVSGAIVVIPISKLIAGTIIPNRKPDTMTKAVKEILSSLSVDDMTLDNGIENKKHDEWGLPTYFADPHAPWQKPHVECSIGLLRKWFLPKGTDLRNVSKKDLKGYFHILNGKYRKSLGYKSAYEVSLEYDILKEIPEIDASYLLERNCI